MPANIQLFCFDFAGCGLSEGKNKFNILYLLINKNSNLANFNINFLGEYISLGWFERDDVEVIVDFLRKSNKVSTIGLWGRSMVLLKNHYFYFCYAYIKIVLKIITKI